jgi:hypothetical protein
MSAIAFELPPEIREACDALTAFARAEVMPATRSIAHCSKTRASSIGKMGGFLTTPSL